VASRVYREECGAPGCDFVAGPSRDQSRVQRIVDAHRATGHVLRAEEPKGRAPVAGSATEYRRQARERAERIVPHLATYRRTIRESGPQRAGVTRPAGAERAERARRRQEREAQVAAILDELRSLLPPSIAVEPPPDRPWAEELRGERWDTPEQERARKRAAAQSRRRAREKAAAQRLAELSAELWSRAR
jgi:hypothetical protein